MNIWATIAYKLRQKGFAVTPYELQAGVKPRPSAKNLTDAIEESFRQTDILAQEEKRIDNLYVM